METAPDAIVLFSGGLDSLLAAKLLESQGLSVLCLHFYSPWFGHASPPRLWADEHGLRVRVIDLSPAFAKMLCEGPARGYGKHLNPCVDCKILQLSRAREIMEGSGARLIATGEVVGQRPMSQRRDSMALIEREAGLRGRLLRPLSAGLLEPTEAEISGLVDRGRLERISGRGRSPQFALAEKFGLKTIPSPAGGCALTQEETSRRVWRALAYHRAGKESGDLEKLSRDLWLGTIGRQFWRREGERDHWLLVGRNKAENERLTQAAEEGDLFLRLARHPSALALCKGGASWGAPVLESAAALAASYSPRAVAAGAPAEIRCFGFGVERRLSAMPSRESEAWALPSWEEIRRALRGKGEPEPA